MGELLRQWASKKKRLSPHNGQLLLLANLWSKKIDAVEEREGKLFGFEMKWGKLRPKNPKDFLKTYKNAQFNVVNQENYLDFITWDDKNSHPRHCNTPKTSATAWNAIIISLFKRCFEDVNHSCPKKEPAFAPAN